MKGTKSRLILTACLLAAAALRAAPVDPPLEQILAHIQVNAAQFNPDLPDFVCDEKVTSRQIKDGKVIREVIVQSLLAGSQKNTGHMSFLEGRKLLDIDGRHAHRDRKLDEPFLAADGFSSVLDLTFSESNAHYHDYKLKGAETFEGRRALVIEFSTKPDQKALHDKWGPKGTLSKDTGRAWIDAETLQVMRIERHHLNVEDGLSPLVETVDYGPVMLSGKSFWMPKTVTAEQTKIKDGEQDSYLGEYSGYGKFDGSSGIVFH